MATIVLDCPHCMSDKMTFDVVGANKLPDEDSSLVGVSVVAFCRECGRGVEAICICDGPGDPSGAITHYANHKIDGDLTRIPSDILISPPRPGPTAPQHLPPEVERAFLQAEDNRIRRNYDSSGMMYRKALDVGTKLKAPDLAGKMLASRIYAMKDAGILTPELADWAHHVRNLGNDSAHESSEPIKEDIEDLANLTEMVLIYLFEMPERIKLMRERKVE